MVIVALCRMLDKIVALALAAREMEAAIFFPCISNVRLLDGGFWSLKEGEVGDSASTLFRTE
jgi:hypothetical protein